MTFSEFLQIVDYLVSFSVFVGGIAAIIFRAWIKEWISARFSRAVNKELADQKHQLNKDLEAYKGSVLRELEEFRANIDIRRSIALKTAGARLDALRALYSDYYALLSSAASHSKLNPEQRVMHHDEFMGAIAAYNQSNRLANIFVPPDIGLQMATAIADLLVIADGPIGQDPAILQTKMQAAVLAGRAIKDEIERPGAIAL